MSDQRTKLPMAISHSTIAPEQDRIRLVSVDVPAAITQAFPLKPSFGIREPLLPNSRRQALRLATIAARHGQAKRWRQGLVFIERAIEYDQCGALDEGYYCARAALLNQLKDTRATRALDRYHGAIQLVDSGEYEKASLEFHAATLLDAECLWALNNLAWLLATCPDESVRAAGPARQFAAVLCRQSQWNCWVFINTLAAALAACGMQAPAIAAAEHAARLAPPEWQEQLQLQIACFRAGVAYVDGGSRVAGGAFPGHAGPITLH